MKLFAVVSVGLSLLSIINAAPVDLAKRRFGVEHTPEADATYQAMKDAVQGTTFEEETGNLSGAAVRALLARAPKCEQQDVADQCIDIAKRIGAAVSKDREERLIPVCQTYRTLERNTPNAGQPSELCDRPPRNKELDGLVQRQDPTGSGTPPAEDPKEEDPKEEDPKEEDPKEEDPKEEDPEEEDPEEDPTNAVPNDNEAFNNPVGGVQMPLIKKLPAGSGANFEVLGNKFQQEGAAHNRQCDVQHNLCFNKFNAGDRSFQGSDCDEQNNVCKSGPAVFEE